MKTGDVVKATGDIDCMREFGAQNVVGRTGVVVGVDGDYATVIFAWIGQVTIPSEHLGVC